MIGARGMTSGSHKVTSQVLFDLACIVVISYIYGYMNLIVVYNITVHKGHAVFTLLQDWKHSYKINLTKIIDFDYTLNMSNLSMQSPTFSLYLTMLNRLS